MTPTSDAAHSINTHANVSGMTLKADSLLPVFKCSKSAASDVLYTASLTDPYRKKSIIDMRSRERGGKPVCPPWAIHRPGDSTSARGWFTETTGNFIFVV